MQMKLSKKKKHKYIRIKQKERGADMFNIILKCIY